MASLARKHLADAEAKRARHGVLDIQNRNAIGAVFHGDSPLVAGVRALSRQRLLGKSEARQLRIRVRKSQTASAWRTGRIVSAGDRGRGPQIAAEELTSV